VNNDLGSFGSFLTGINQKTIDQLKRVFFDKISKGGWVNCKGKLYFVLSFPSCYFSFTIFHVLLALLLKIHSQLLQPTSTKHSTKLFPDIIQGMKHVNFCDM